MFNSFFSQEFSQCILCPLSFPQVCTRLGWRYLLYKITNVGSPLLCWKASCYLHSLNSALKRVDSYGLNINSWCEIKNIYLIWIFSCAPYFHKAKSTCYLERQATSSNRSLVIFLVLPTRSKDIRHLNFFSWSPFWKSEFLTLLIASGTLFQDTVCNIK